MRHQQLTEAILLSPALQRLHTVFRQDRLSIVPSEPVTQREDVLHPFRRHGRPINHLRFYLKLLVHAEKRVVDEIAVVAHDVGGLPDGIEDFQIGLRHQAEGLPVIPAADRWCAQCRNSYSRGRTSEDMPATVTLHPWGSPLTRW